VNVAALLNECFIQIVKGVQKRGQFLCLEMMFHLDRKDCCNVNRARVAESAIG